MGRASRDDHRDNIQLRNLKPELGDLTLVYAGLGRTLVAGSAAGIGGLGTHALRHSYRAWLDSVGTPVGVQQRLMRHADVRTTMNQYGEAMTSDMIEAHGKIVGLALNGLPADCKPS